MPRDRVDAVGHEHVVVPRALLHNVREVRPRRVHRDSADGLAASDDEGGRDHDEEVVLHPREEVALDKVLEDAEGPGADPLRAVVDEEGVPRELLRVEERDEGPLPHVVDGEEAQEQPKVEPAPRGKQRDPQADAECGAQGPPDVDQRLGVGSPEE